MIARRSSRLAFATLLLLATLPLLTGFGGVMTACQSACTFLRPAPATTYAAPTPKACCKGHQPAPATGECPWLAKLAPAVPTVGKIVPPTPPTPVMLFAAADVPAPLLTAQSRPRPALRHPPPTPVSLSVRLNC